jgi:uncharacterized protein
VRILGFEPAKARAFEAVPDWTGVTIKARTYPGQERDVVVPGTHTALLAYRAAPDALIYRIVKAIVEHGRELGALQPSGDEFTARRTRLFVEQRLVPTAFHPGAARYWQERGVLK